MDMPVAVFVVIVAGTALVALMVGFAFARWRRRRAPKSGVGQLKTTEQALRKERDEAIRSARRELERANRLRADLDDAASSLERVESRLRESDEVLLRARDDSVISKRQLAEFRTRFSDIVGLEAENATLRAIAARVPELERRLAELESELPQVIDLREQAPAPTN